MEVAERRVELKMPLHDLEAVIKGHIEGSPHLLGDVAEAPLACLDLLVQELSLLGAAAVVVEEDVPRVLEAYRLVKV